MNPGELTERIHVLTLTKADNTYSWESAAMIWAKAERLNNKNIFSSIGIGVNSIKFTIRQRELTLHNALRWEGKHCFLTDINEIDRMYYEVTAALIEPVICTVEKTGEPTPGDLNRPVYGDPVLLTFPGCLTEKYIRSSQEDPMSVIEKLYVLVTPKVISLDEGELVKIGDVPYEVLASHVLDSYKNEYEISARRDA